MLKPFLFILQHIWQSSHKWTLLQTLLLLLTALLPLYAFWQVKTIIDTISLNGHFDLILLRGPLILLAITLIVNNIAQNISTFVGEIQEQLIQDHFSGIIQDHSIALDMAYYDNPDFHATLHRAQEEAAYRPGMVLQSILSILQSSLSVLMVGVLLFYQHWIIVFLLLITAVPAVFVKIYFSRKLFNIAKQNTSLEMKSWYLGWVLTKAAFAKELRLFNFGRQLRERFKALREKLFLTIYHIKLHRSMASAIVQVVEALTFVAALSYIIYLAGKGKMSTGALVMYYQVFQRGQASLQQFLQSLVLLYHNQLFVKHIYDFLQIHPQMTREKPMAKIPQRIEHITFKSIHFTYPHSKKGVLHDIDIQFHRGQVIALVGENGSGKTTFIKLLCRLYDVTKGEILINGINVKQFDFKEWRQHITVIFQDFMKYQFTVKENIQISDLHSDAHDNNIIQAAEKTFAATFINDLADGYETTLGKDFIDGTELSGGQWQKIALARAFYKNADIIVLDEPTSAIDPLAEHDIFLQFKSMARDKILILITHRLYNLKIADQIYVFDKGKIIESGNHDELILKGGKYFQMFEKQLV